ncbi:response regulator transcription factor [Aeromonas schubertii]|uniref:Response regulator transcription factor n=1 Tax=Aeromonas schubertii TaxID=652 RepID=A0A0S2SII8_9GAMM|nr:response regulator transcription factor [Aeromonas schubertii]ALP41526.1 two-component system, regulatory protein [Aeromonas schubertii]KUE79621.1 two-component system response regulator [Aeromonas schubertii]MBZ6065350.1 response regulator transcription factor [Aeromonas schubertii]MBZ6072392.1 response regulator transcription factor [Aeromonas schubertii]QCG49288.1 response regulator transcription factor [Aeromonas schubertii]
MRILIVEDEKTLAAQLAEQLNQAGFVADLCHDGVEASFLGATEPYDAIVLDLGLPGRDGLSVLKEWRSQGMDNPVLVLTARGQLHEKIEGLNAGADDYLTKPFQMAELVARVHALVRRAAGNASSVLEIRGVRLDMAASQVWYEGTPIKLTAHEFRVLAYLMQHKGRVVSRSELIDHIYAQDFDRDSNTVEVFIGRIRKKTHPDLIETVRGLGYRIDE